MNIIVTWIDTLDVRSGKVIKLSGQKVHTGQRRIISALKDLSRSDKVLYGISELEYHADTTFAGENCCIFKCTVKWGDVSPYCNGYEVIKCVPIVHVGTYWQSPETGKTYILIIREHYK